jgi:hypothetical protein
VTEQAEPGIKFGADLVRQPGELGIDPGGKRVGPVVVQHADAGQDVGDRHVPGGQLPDRAGAHRLARPWTAARIRRPC